MNSKLVPTKIATTKSSLLQLPSLAQTNTTATDLEAKTESETSHENATMSKERHLETETEKVGMSTASEESLSRAIVVFTHVRATSDPADKFAASIHDTGESISESTKTTATTATKTTATSATPQSVFAASLCWRAPERQSNRGQALFLSCLYVLAGRMKRETSAKKKWRVVGFLRELLNDYRPAVLAWKHVLESRYVLLSPADTSIISASFFYLLRALVPRSVDSSSLFEQSRVGITFLCSQSEIRHSIDEMKHWMLTQSTSIDAIACRFAWPSVSSYGNFFFCFFFGLCLR